MDKKAFFSNHMDEQNDLSSNTGGFAVRHKTSFSSLYRLIDLLLITVLFYSSYFLFGKQLHNDELIFLFVFVIAFQLLAESFDLYRSWRGHSTIDILKTTFYCWSISFITTLTIGIFFYSSVSDDQNVLLTWFASSSITLISWRFVMRKFLFHIRKIGLNSRQAVIVGATKTGYNLAKQIEKNEQLGIHFNGVYDDRSPDRVARSDRYKVLGRIDDAIELAKAGKIDYVYIALPMGAEPRIREILDRCADTTANVYIIPNFFVYNLMNSRWQSVGSVEALSVYDTPFQGASDLLKRTEDIVLSLIILAFLTVPMSLIALAVKLTSKGPVIFKQKRYGLDGKQILVYKFRSMRTQDNGPVVKQAQKNDPRITKLGAFLRKTSLDELPQFINVLQGRMSIVGPRPHAVAHNEEYRKLIKGYMLRHKVRPGITGWAQVNGYRGETEQLSKMVKRVEYDIEYIHRWSLLLDLKIIFLTVFKGFVDKNAY